MTANALQKDFLEGAAREHAFRVRDRSLEAVRGHDDPQDNDFQLFAVEARRTLQAVSAATEYPVDNFMVGPAVHEELLSGEWLDERLVVPSHSNSPDNCSDLAGTVTITRREKVANEIERTPYSNGAWQLSYFNDTPGIARLAAVFAVPFWERNNYPQVLK